MVRLEALFPDSAGKLGQLARDFLSEAVGRPEVDTDQIARLWGALRRQIDELNQEKDRFALIRTMTDRIGSSGAPTWARRLATEPAEDGTDPLIPADWRDAWDWAAASAYLARIDAIPSGRRPPSLVAQSARYRARLAAARNEHDGVEQGFKTAEAVFREHGLTFFVAATELEHAEWLFGQERRDDAEPLLVEAREIFDRLEAAPWIERCDRLAPARAATVSV